MQAKRWMERDLSRAMEHAKVLSSTELNWEAYQRLKIDLNLVDREVSEEGDRTQGGGEEVRGFVGFMFSALLFLVLAVYGGLIIRSVVEEKSNRVVEVLIAAVRPEELAAGQGDRHGGRGPDADRGVERPVHRGLFGVPIRLRQRHAVRNRWCDGPGEVPADLLTVMAENETTRILLDINWGLMAISTILFFVGGYLLYGSLYAAIGSSVSPSRRGRAWCSPYHAAVVRLCLRRSGDGKSRHGGL